MIVQSYYVNNIRAPMEAGGMFEWRLWLPKAKQRYRMPLSLHFGGSANKEEG